MKFPIMSRPGRAALTLFPLALCVVLASYGGQAAQSAALAGYRDGAGWAEPAALADNPNVRLTTLADTPGGPLRLITVGSGDMDHKPAIAVLGSVSATLPVGAELALRLAQRLAGEAQPGGAGQALFERVTFYIIPRPSPESLRGFYDRPTFESHTNSRPVDDDHDGLVDEDGGDDLNGDGLITMLRVADPTGNWRTHPADPRLLIEADTGKNEQGGYLLYAEGIDNDADEQFNEDPPGGVDANRNFPFRYPFFTAGAGPHQVSEPETRALADFFIGHPNIALVFCYSSEDNLLHPWRSGNDSPPGPHQGSILADDERCFGYLSEQYKKLLEPAGLSRNQPAISRGEGSLGEWAYYGYGRFSLACLPWWPVVPEKPAADAAPAEEAAPAAEAQTKPDQAQEQKPPAEPVEDVGERGKAELEALAWLEATGQDGFVAWTKVEHPDFPGKLVEVGGFKPYMRTNPPAAALDQLAELHCGFIKQLAGLLPALAVTEAKVEQLGGDVRRVTVKVANTGYLPTMSAMGEQTRAVFPLQYTLKLPAGAELINCYPRGRVVRLAGNGGSTELTWLIRGQGSLGLTIASPAVTPVSAVVDLQTGKLEVAQ